MKSKIILSSLAGAAVVGSLALTPVAANAQEAINQFRNGSGNGNGNGYQNSLQTRAEAVNMSADDLSEALKTRTMEQIRIDQGVSEEAYQAQRREASKARWESRGMSEEQVQERSAWQQEKQAASDGECDGTGEGQSGYGRQNR